MYVYLFLDLGDQVLFLSVTNHSGICHLQNYSLPVFQYMNLHMVTNSNRNIREDIWEYVTKFASYPHKKESLQMQMLHLCHIFQNYPTTWISPHDRPKYVGHKFLW